MERLQKKISQSGYASRRHAEELIKNGKVYVNGIKVTEMGFKVSGNDSIVIDGKTLEKEDKVYYLLNKPKGVISSVKDEKGRKTVVDLIDTDKRIYPVGRLDFNTTGLLILTNDGELSDILTHPSNEVPKKYVVKINKYLQLKDLKKLQSGIVIEGIKCIPTRVKVRANSIKKDSAIVEVTIIEGRNHIIKKLFSRMGYKVVKLNRIELGFLYLDFLPIGSYRPLTIKEVKKLYQYKK